MTRLTPEKRAEWREDAERRRDGRGNTPQNQQILALLDALDDAEDRVTALEAKVERLNVVLDVEQTRHQDLCAEINKARKVAEIEAECATGYPDAPSWLWAASTLRDLTKKGVNDDTPDPRG